MGRTTLTNRHPLNVNKKELEEHYNHMAAMENWREGTRGLSESIYWKDDHVFENIKEAVNYIDSNKYDQVAVKFKERTYPGDSFVKARRKSLDDLKKKVLDEMLELEENSLHKTRKHHNSREYSKLLKNMLKEIKEETEKLEGLGIKWLVRVSM